MKGSYRRDVDERVLGLSGKVTLVVVDGYLTARSGRAGECVTKVYLSGVSCEKVRSRWSAVIGEGE